MRILLKVETYCKSIIDDSIERVSVCQLLYFHVGTQFAVLFAVTAWVVCPVKTFYTSEFDVFRHKRNIVYPNSSSTRDTNKTNIWKVIAFISSYLPFWFVFTILKTLKNINNGLSGHCHVKEKANEITVAFCGIFEN